MAAAVEAALRVEAGQLMAFYLRGALVEFMPDRPHPIPNVIIFQYNPETMTHRGRNRASRGGSEPDAR